MARGIRHSLVLSLTTLCLCLSLLVSTHRTVWAQKDIPSEVNSLIEELKDPNEKVLKRMNLNRITETDLFGTFHLRVPGGDKYAGYYSSLDAIRPLLNSEEWKENITGFYLNVAGDFDGVRISYWTTSPEQTQQTVDEFVAEHGLEYIRNPSTPVQTRNSQQYGGEELRFRRFLATYTQIGLDIMEADLLNARRLFATFRLKVMIGRQPYKPHFIGTFENHSPFYNDFSDAEKDQFWLDIAHWPNPPQVDWAHMMVNMVLGCDWNQIFQQASLPPLSISEINQIIRNQGFQIPQDWQPIEPQT